MTLSLDPPVPSLADLDDGEVAAMATGILMVRYQLTHDQARNALATRAQRARLELRDQAEQIITSQDASIRRWVSGPARGAFDGGRPSSEAHLPA